MPANLLVVDDERDICKALEFILSREGYVVTTAHSGEEAVELLKKRDFDVVLTDLKMEKMDGIELLEEVKRQNQETQVVLMTAYASVESAVNAMKKGASDYIVKPFINEEIRLTIRRLIEQMRLRSENIALKQELSQHRGRCKEFIFGSESMGRVIDMLENVIPTKSNILLLGESGTGKGLVAEIIHCSSQRRDNPFISINCSAIPETLLESELFGYKKGAFTGAVADKKGLILLADAGTLFLDEIGDMPLQLQAKILKVIETGEVMPLGDTKPKHSDIRLVSATNQDLERRVKENAFREDLYYRLNVIEIKIPPLRERKEDVKLLSEFFMSKYAGINNKDIKSIDEDAMEALISYRWPGNVRELGNVMERAVIMASKNIIYVENLPDKVRAEHTYDISSNLKSEMNEHEKNFIKRIYEANKKSKEATAHALGVDVATLYRKMKKFEIED